MLNNGEISHQCEFACVFFNFLVLRIFYFKLTTKRLFLSLKPFRLLKFFILKTLKVHL